MKKTIILLAAILIGYTAQSQVIDTTVTSITACKIDKVKAKFTDKGDVTHLGIRVISDDLRTSATLLYVFLLSDGTNSLEGNYTVSGNEYKNWNRNVLKLFDYVGKALKLTFVK